MGAKVPTKVSLGRAVQLCLMALFHPKRFAEAEAADNALLNVAPNAPAELSALKVRRALVSSLALVLLAGAIGWAAGSVLNRWYGPACTSTIALLQTVGALILLWATLAVRGWDIVTYASVTLSERVNQWIYRFLYCCGSAVLVWSVFWQSRACG
jgi:drug/metabolite transporter (DMT)-like permease